MNRRSPECLDLLAGEYVMGTLRGPARRRFEALMRADALLRARVGAWEGRLARLADAVPPVEPPAHVWRGIERTLALAASRPARSPRRGLWESVPFWRNLALAASLAVAALTALVVPRLGGGPDWGEEMIAHVIEDRRALEVRQAVSPATLAETLAHAEVRLVGDLGEATFLGYCIVGGRMGVHLVVNTPYGRATVIVLPGAEVGVPQRRDASGYSALVVPLRAGVLGLVTDAPQALPEVEAYLRRQLL